MTLLKAIREYCVSCAEERAGSVESCIYDQCPLYSYRQRKAKKPLRYKIIKRYRNGKPVKTGGEWFDVMDKQTNEVFQCPHTDLPKEIDQ